MFYGSLSIGYCVLKAYVQSDHRANLKLLRLLMNRKRCAQSGPTLRIAPMSLAQIRRTGFAILMIRIALRSGSRVSPSGRSVSSAPITCKAARQRRLLCMCEIHMNVHQDVLLDQSAPNKPKFMKFRAKRRRV